MIIWSRWGFLSFLAFGAAVGCGFPLAYALHLDNTTVGAAMIFVFGAGFNALLAFFAYPRLDKPRPVTYTEKLPQPVRLPNGQTRTHEVRPVFDQNGQQLWVTPRSTLFFIPGRFWWILSLTVAVILGVVSIFRG